VPSAKRAFMMQMLRANQSQGSRHVAISPG
jgi:hypothetical protein